MINIQEKLEDGTELYGWKSEPPLTPFAPSYAHYLTDKKIFSEEECKEWNTYLLTQERILLDKFRTTFTDGGTGLGGLSITSRYRDFNVLKFNFHLVERLKIEIFNGIRCLLDISGNTAWQDTLYANCWFNVLRQGEQMAMHSHGYHSNIFYGFHLNINVIETFTSYIHPIKFQEDTFHVPNKIGYLTLFPCLVPHSVSMNRYITPRITIAGDIFPASGMGVQLLRPDITEIEKSAVKIGTIENNTPKDIR